MQKKKEDKGFRVVAYKINLIEEKEQAFLCSICDIREIGLFYLSF